MNNYLLADHLSAKLKFVRKFLTKQKAKIESNSEKIHFILINTSTNANINRVQ
jgi:hypothetical protein